MGQEMEGQLGQVLDVRIYEYQEKERIVKIKITFDINQPTRAWMYIDNDQDGITWVDFRFENLPLFCFGCGLIGHNLKNCKNQPIPIEGGTNPRGAWLRSKDFGRRVVECKEKTLCNNPLRSMSGGKFSPIPKGLLSKMTDLNIRKTKGLFDCTF